MKNIDESLLKIEKQLELLTIKVDIILHKLTFYEQAEKQKLRENMEDDLFEEAKEVVIAANKGTAALIQRRLQVGYARAARLLDILEQEGIVGPSKGDFPREVLVKE